MAQLPVLATAPAGHHVTVCGQEEAAAGRGSGNAATAPTQRLQQQRANNAAPARSPSKAQVWLLPQETLTTLGSGSAAAPAAATAPATMGSLVAQHTHAAVSLSAAPMNV